MCSSKKFCTVLMKKLYNSKTCYLVAQGYLKVTSCKYDRVRYEMIGEAQPEMELLEVVAFVYPFFLKVAGQYHLLPEFDSPTQLC